MRSTRARAAELNRIVAWQPTHDRNVEAVNRASQHAIECSERLASAADGPRDAIIAALDQLNAAGEQLRTVATDALDGPRTGVHWFDHPYRTGLAAVYDLGDYVARLRIDDIPETGFEDDTCIRLSEAYQTNYAMAVRRLEAESSR